MGKIWCCEFDCPKVAVFKSGAPYVIRTLAEKKGTLGIHLLGIASSTIQEFKA